MAKTYRNDAVLLSKHMSQDERHTASAFMVSYGISIDFDRLDTFWAAAKRSALP
jgi:hypothetical protein